MRDTLVTAAVRHPVTIDEVKAQCRVQQDWEDALFAGWISGITQALQPGIRRQLITETRKTTWDGPPVWSWVRGEYSLDFGRSPVQSITNVQYIDTAGVTQTLDASIYRLAYKDGPIARVVVNPDQTFPEVMLRSESVWATYVCGYGDYWGDVPEPIRQWIILQVAGRNEFREPLTEGQVSELPYNFTDGLLDSYRVETF